MTTAVAKRNPIRPSNMNRTCLCPPSPWREQEAAISHASEDASEGTRLHAAIRCICETGDPPAGLTEEQLGIVSACYALMKEHYRAGDESNFAMLENTIPMRGSLGLDILERMATPDVVIVSAERIVVIDWKTGRLEPDFPVGPDPEDEGNQAIGKPKHYDLQMQCYAIAARNHYRFHGQRINTVRAIRFHPRLWDKHRKGEIILSGGDDEWLEMEQNIQFIVDRSKPEVEANPGGPQCRYCKASLGCQEFQQWSSQFIINVDWEKLPVPVLAQAYKRLVEIEAPLRNAIATAKEALLTLPEEELEANGLRLQNTGCTRSLPNIFEARARWEQYYPKLAFESCLSVSVPDLQTVFQSQTGCKKSQAGAMLAEFFDGLIEVKEKAKSLKVVK